MKNILITGSNSYIGTSVEKWLLKESEKYKVDTIDMKDGTWKEKDFSKYDVVFHVAGIAHVSTDPNMKDLYYKVNTELTIDTAIKAKNDGVKQFIFMSSIIVYGDSSSSKRVITKETIPSPSNFYGDSKLKAENGIKEIETDDFKVVIIRPPMIYGKGSKGNYPRLAKLACRIPIFPNINNERSMLYIENLCEFIKVMIDYEESGTFFPQNKEYVKTSEMVKIIAEVHNKKLRLTKAFNWSLHIMSKVNTVNKVFGNLVYDKKISEYPNKDYQIIGIKESIEKTEGRD